MPTSEESHTIWTFPWSPSAITEGEVPVQIDDAGGLFLDPDEVAKSKTFEEQLRVMTELAEAGGTRAS